MFDKYNKLMDKLFDKNRDEYVQIDEAIKRLADVGDTDEYNEVYEGASDLGKKAMDAYSHDFADAAIGDSSWRNGTDFED